MNAVQFDDVALGHGRRQVVSDVSFSVPRGAFVAVLGANGSGKTTVLRAMLGLLRPTRGSIRVLGSSPHRGHAAIGYMPQFRRGAAQLGLSGFDLVLGALGGRAWARPIASREHRRLAAEALAEVGGADLARRPVCELSGGERQRVLFAQALLGRPELLLLDEPLISLDPGHQRTLVEAVRRIADARGSTVLFCAHEINPLLGAADLVLYLGRGAAALGTVDEVINPDSLSRLYGTPINVVRVDGRIIVTARDGELDTYAHHHDG